MNFRKKRFFALSCYFIIVFISFVDLTGKCDYEVSDCKPELLGTALMLMAVALVVTYVIYRK